MYIDKIIIKNYRNFQEFELKLKPFTLIIGENNAGKSNFLNAIGLIFSKDITFFTNRNLEIDDINLRAVEDFKNEIVNTTKPIDEVNIPKIEITAEMIDFNDDQEAVVADWFINKELDRAKITYLFQPKLDLNNWLTEERDRISKMTIDEKENEDDFKQRKINSINFPINKYSYSIFGGLNQTKEIDHYFLKMLKFEFLDAVRDVKKHLIASTEYRLLYKILANRGDRKYDDILKVISKLDDIVKKNEELKKIVKQISQYLAKTSLADDEFKNEVNFRFSKIEEQDILKKLSLIYSDSPISIERNGTGRNNLLYISLLLSHLINVESDSVYFRLIGIEEPEAHLHPHLQEHLAQNVENEVTNQLQIIITSHSTHITSKLSLNNTVIFFKKDGNIENHYILDGFKPNESGNLSSKDRQHIKYLEKFLDSTKSTLFYARRVILVEGISEQILIPLLFQIHTGKKLEEMGCSVINVNGVAFSHFLEIIKKGFFIKSLVLTDSDINKKTAIRSTNLKEEYDDDQILVSITEKTDTFEKEIISFNSDDKSKNILLDTLSSTRRNISKGFRKEYKDKPIDLERYFELIENYKSDFASDLKHILQELPDQQKSTFNIPNYILDGFNHIISDLNESSETE
ncbi:MAG: AAA family ATPase [Planctomycetia bacterium]|nr:AAA family ATPase [Planctomycetia bacterium]